MTRPRWFIFPLVFFMTVMSGWFSNVHGADWGILMIDLGKQDRSEGILRHENADGITEADTVGGEDARVIPKTPPGLNTGNHIYFIIDPTVVQGKAKESKVWIAVEFFDEADGGATGIFMDYDDKGDAYPQQAFALGLPKEGRLIPFTNTGEWQIAIIAVEQAEFKEQGNGGDFRFHIDPYMSGDFALNRVWVSNHEITEADLGSVQAITPGDKLTTLWGQLKHLR